MLSNFDNHEFVIAKNTVYLIIYYVSFSFSFFLSQMSYCKWNT